MMMTDARGKLGGHVFTKARNGATVRTKVTPTNPRTIAQSLARSIFGTVSAAWRGLNEAERSAWNAAVGDFSRTNIFGDNYNPSGKNLFVQLNCNLLNVGMPVIDTPPSPSGLPDFILQAVEMENSAETVDLTFTGTEPGAGFMKVIEATRPFSPGKYNFSGAYAKIYSYNTGGIGTPAAIYEGYISKYGAPAIGQKVSFRAYIVEIATGLKSIPTEASTIIEA